MLARVGLDMCLMLRDGGMAWVGSKMAMWAREGCYCETCFIRIAFVKQESCFVVLNGLDKGIVVL